MCVHLLTNLLLWSLKEQLGNEYSMRDELQPGVGKTRGTAWSNDVVHLARGDDYVSVCI